MADQKTPRSQLSDVAQDQMTLEQYLIRCEELRIQRVEPCTAEFVAWPGPRVKKEKGGND